MQGVAGIMALPHPPADPVSVAVTGSAEASASKRDQNPDAHVIAHEMHYDTPG
jgi:hypothetical protein